MKAPGMVITAIIIRTATRQTSIARACCAVFLSDDDYHQTNYYYWADGKKEVRDFPALYHAQEKRILFTGVIEGWAAEVTLDQ